MPKLRLEFSADADRVLTKIVYGESIEPSCQASSEFAWSSAVKALCMMFVEYKLWSLDSPPDNFVFQGGKGCDPGIGPSPAVSLSGLLEKANGLKWTKSMFPSTPPGRSELTSLIKCRNAKAKRQGPCVLRFRTARLSPSDISIVIGGRLLSTKQEFEALLNALRESWKGTRNFTTGVQDGSKWKLGDLTPDLNTKAPVAPSANENSSSLTAIAPFANSPKAQTPISNWLSATAFFRLDDQLAVETALPSQQDWTANLVPRARIADIVEDAIRNHQDAVLRGKPGSGKTTVAMHVARSWEDRGGSVFYTSFADPDIADHLQEIDRRIAENSRSQSLIILDDAQLDVFLATQIWNRSVLVSEGVPHFLFVTDHPADPRWHDEKHLFDNDKRAIDMRLEPYEQARVLNGLWERVALGRPHPPELGADVSHQLFEFFHGDLTAMSMAFSVWYERRLAPADLLSQGLVGEFIQRNALKGLPLATADSLKLLAQAALHGINLPVEILGASISRALCEAGLVRPIPKSKNHPQCLMLVNQSLGRFLGAGDEVSDWIGGAIRKYPGEFPALGFSWAARLKPPLAQTAMLSAVGSMSKVAALEPHVPRLIVSMASTFGEESEFWQTLNASLSEHGHLLADALLQANAALFWTGILNGKFQPPKMTLGLIEALRRPNIRAKVFEVALADELFPRMEEHLGVPEHRMRWKQLLKDLYISVDNGVYVLVALYEAGWPVFLKYLKRYDARRKKSDIILSIIVHRANRESLKSLLLERTFAQFKELALVVKKSQSLSSLATAIRTLLKSTDFELRLVDSLRGTASSEERAKALPVLEKCKFLPEGFAEKVCA